MTLTIRQEALFDVIHEVEPLLELHYQEVALHKEAIPLAPIWEKYRHLEAAGAFVLYAARDAGRLVGYSAFFINEHLHYGSTVVAHNDVIFLHPDVRRGAAGIRLIKFSEQALRERGVRKVTWHVKCQHNFGPILERLGYTAEDTIYGKIL